MSDNSQLSKILDQLSNQADKEFVQQMAIEIKNLQRTIQQQQKSLSDYGWILSPDRMGGQVSDREIIERYERW